MENNLAPIRPYLHKELAALYTISWPTFTVWIKPFSEEIGQKVGHYYTKKQVEKIFELLEHPDAPQNSLKENRKKSYRRRKSSQYMN